MFRAVFSALKRAFDLTLAPIIMGALALLLEWLVAGVSWFLVPLADTFIYVIASLLNLIQLPDDVGIGDLPNGVLDFLSLIGFWPAATLVTLAAVTKKLLSMSTLGLVK